MDMMNQALHTEDLAEQMAMESLTGVIQKVEACCQHECQRIALVNESRIVGLRAEYAQMLLEERELVNALRHAPPCGMPEHRERPGAYTWSVVIILTIAGFIFSLIAFEPFQVGWKGYLYSLGIAVVTPYLVDKVLVRSDTRRLVRSFALIAFVAAMAGLIFLAIIRGNILAQPFTAQSAVVLFDDAAPPPPQNDFYGATVWLLRATMVLLAVAMELGAGLALYDGWQVRNQTPDNWELLRDRLTAIRRRLMMLPEEMTELKNEPAIFAERFWRNFRRAALAHFPRHGGMKLLLLLLCALPLFHLQLSAQEHIAIVVAVDLTQSVAAPGADGQTDFLKNIAGVTRLLAQVPASSHITILGITDKSFSQPYILLSARVPDDAGYFGERLQSARGQLVRAWKARAAKLKPEFPATDILGALLIAGQLFDQDKNAGRKILIVFSDMRQNTRDLDLESPPAVLNFALLEYTHRKTLPPANLRGVQVYVLGADGAGKSMQYWQSLQEFWAAYFRKSSATLGTYSVLRELPALKE
ncbi:MAG TPA: hypothetical protein VFK06_25065 [Candidatus Angelobacter sp.]|nr:hypothetical protein [Candidatus Angelobacter sp.]